jgi:hypothetical protein
LSHAAKQQQFLGQDGLAGIHARRSQRYSGAKPRRSGVLINPL